MEKDTFGCSPYCLLCGDLQGKYACVNPKCECHATDTTGWAEEFYKKRKQGYFTNSVNGSMNGQHVEEFITELLSTQKREIRERIQSTDWIRTADDSWGFGFEEGRQAMKEEVLALLDESSSL